MMKPPSVISLAPSEGRIASAMPTFAAIGRIAIDFVARRWVTWALVLVTAGSVATAITLGVLSAVKQ